MKKNGEKKKNVLNLDLNSYTVGMSHPVNLSVILRLPLLISPSTSVSSSFYSSPSSSQRPSPSEGRDPGDY